ncbi:MAG: phosphoglycerate mutase family protein [Firmicutes bacterium]|nr:phosphoglycerate mutase family protein [Bacillota bacterium]
MGTIYFVRHGQTDADKQNRFNGGIDLDLNETGVAQASNQAKQLSKINFDSIFCSPKKRAIQTCQIVASGQDFKIDSRLAELVCGRFDGKNKNLISKIRFFGSLKKGKRGVERLDDFVARNVNFCKLVLGQLGGKTILVVSHHGNASAFDFYFKGQPKGYSFAKHIIENGEVIKFEL